ncbi:unnamed protein product [Adineta ricciae]|uniref:DUF4201 domain-containing protein n=1 Tax=Adineta ricciae TaxID=249248 RepID=A0A813SV53_ADIRI|nr:unnamed protein product [Adineta ricciae]CAF0800245.1 unnamed protein product [Adineta ricciae]
MTNRLVNRIRHSTTELEILPIERIGRTRRGLSLETSPLKSSETVNRFEQKYLMDAIEEIRNVQRNLRLENILYTWYLRRVESSKMIETFDEFNDESDIRVSDIRTISNRNLIHAKLPEIARRLSTKKHSLDPSNAAPLWSKLVSNWREHMYEAFLLRVEQEKLSIAAYEIEQTKLDWERMKVNAQLSLEDYDVLLRSVQSDIVAQQMLNHDIEKQINVPVELLINRIHKRVHSRLSSIGLLRINRAQTQLRIRALDLMIYNLQHSEERTQEIDVNFVRTRKIDYLDTFMQLDRQYKIEKSSQYPIRRQLQELQNKVVEQEEETISCENKRRLLGNHLVKINQEIECIQRENNDLIKENEALKHRLVDIKEVPSITSYAYIMERTKDLQHQIDVWTRRVTIAEALLSQTKRESKSSYVLPPIRQPTLAREQ